MKLARELGDGTGENAYSTGAGVKITKRTRTGEGNWGKRGLSPSYPELPRIT